MKVITSWDDGFSEDVRLAEIFRRHGAKATFNLCLGHHRPERYIDWKVGDYDVWRLSLGELPEVYAGFEIANHSLTHPHLTKCDDAALQRELVDGRKRLEDCFQRSVRGFVYPCGMFDQRVKDAVRSTGHVYARTVEEQTPCYPAADPMEFASTCHFKSEHFWTRFEQARQKDQLFFFWGHGFEIIGEPAWQAFDQMVQRISATPGVEWSFIEPLFA